MWFATIAEATKALLYGGRNPLTGLCGLQLRLDTPIANRLLHLSQSPYGAMWFATTVLGVHGNRSTYMSQSPYGAMWFATPPRVGNGPLHQRKGRNPLTGLCGLQPEECLLVLLGAQGGLVAIPLRGYVVCNMKSLDGSWPPWKRVAIPLRGYVVCNPGTWRPNIWGRPGSQSPYGAMWFATLPP